MSSDRVLGPSNDNDGMGAKDLYKSFRGDQYYAQRAAQRASEVQRERSELFADIEREDAVILDFGCGNGGLLSNLKAIKRIGVEVSPPAAKEAKATLDLVVESLSEINDETIDIVISNHAFEHIANPVETLRNIRRVLVPGGWIKIVVPCEMPLIKRDHRHWHANDMDMHLYTWTPLLLGNLLKVCEFDVMYAKLVPDSAGGRIGRMLPPQSKVRKLLSYYKALRNGRFHTVAVARKFSDHASQ